MILNIVLTAAFAASCATRAPAPVADAASDPGAPVPGARLAAGARVIPARVDARGRVTRAPERDESGAVLDLTEGEATYYASKFDGRRAASGIVFRNGEPYGAHRSFPFGTLVRVTNLANGRSAIVRIIDRGPHGASERARRTIIDVSQSIARELDFIRAGRVPVRVEVLEWGPGGK